MSRKLPLPTPICTTHLSEEQVDDVLLGDTSPALAVHLADCPACAARVLDLQSTIDAFNDVTLAWGERASAVLPLRPAQLVPPPAPRASLAWSAVGALALGIILPVAVHDVATRTAHSPAETAADIPGERASLYEAGQQQQIARDNLVLRAIDRELHAGAESPDSFGLQPIGTAALVGTTGIGDGDASPLVQN